MARKVYSDLDDMEEPSVNYWNGEVRITVKGENDTIIQKRIDKLGKECTTCKTHMPFKWFQKDKKGKLLARCVWCKRAANSKNYKTTKKQTRLYNKQKQHDMDFWNKSEAFIDYLCFEKNITREACLDIIYKTEHICLPSIIDNFNPPPGLGVIKNIKTSIPEVKSNYKRGPDVDTNFNQIKTYADNMTAATAREIILSYKDGVCKRGTLIKGALYKLNREEIDNKTDSTNQRYDILTTMTSNLPLM